MCVVPRLSYSFAGQIIIHRRSVKYLIYIFHVSICSNMGILILRGDNMRHRASVSVLALVFIAAGLWLCIGSETVHAKTVAEWETGFLNIDYQLQARAGWRDQGVDPSQEQNTRDLYVRRNRISFLGAATETIGFAVQFEYNGGQKLGDTRVLQQQNEYDLTVLDYYLTADFSDAVKFRVGKTKHIVTREVNEGCFDPLSIDRSIFITGPFSQSRPEKTTRDYGVVGWGNLAENKFQYKLAVMQGNDYGSNIPDDIGYRYSGRVHVSLFDPEAGHGYKGSYLGKKKVLTVGAGYEIQPDAVISGTGAEDYTALSYDIFYERPTDMGTITLSGAYYETDFNNAGVQGVADAMGANGEKNGSYWKAGYMVGKVQVYGRYEDWSFADLNNVPSQGVKLKVGGVNYYIKGQDLRVTVEYSMTDFAKENASNKDFKTILAQLQVRF